MVTVIVLGEELIGVFPELVFHAILPDLVCRTSSMEIGDAVTPEVSPPTEVPEVVVVLPWEDDILGIEGDWGRPPRTIRRLSGSSSAKNEGLAEDPRNGLCSGRCKDSELPEGEREEVLVASGDEGGTFGVVTDEEECCGVLVVSDRKARGFMSAVVSLSEVPS